MKKFSEMCDEERIVDKLPTELTNDDKVNIDEIRLFINRVNNNSGYVDFVDAFRLISYYIDVFGIKYMDRFSIEDELMYYYEQLKSFINKENSSIKDYRKKCHTCKEIKEINEFTKRRGVKDGLEYKCKSCIKEYRDNRKKTFNL